MKTDQNEIITETVCSVFEQMAFMFGEEAEPDMIPKDSGGLKSVRMTFSGHSAGSLVMLVCNRMCTELAANILGSDPLDDDALSNSTDSLKEILNVICGNLLTEISGEDAVYDLSIPGVRDISESEWKSMVEKQSVAAMHIDDYPVLVELDFRE